MKDLGLRCIIWTLLPILFVAVAGTFHPNQLVKFGSSFGTRSLFLNSSFTFLYFARLSITSSEQSVYE